MADKRLTSYRRTLQQLVHCTKEALASHEHRDDPRHVRDDLLRAKKLIEQMLPVFRAQARGAARGDEK